jgi:hypothetical protein
MTVTLLNAGNESDGDGNSCGWLVDYDSTAKTIGTSVTLAGTCVVAILVVTVSATGDKYTLDCINGPGGNITNLGRVVLGGPGSVIGQTKPVNNLPVPPFLPKGTPPPYDIDFFWHQ